MGETNWQTLELLRKKTDRQLLDLVRRETERSWQLALRGLLDEAQTRIARASNLLAVCHAPEQARAELEARLTNVRDAIVNRRRPGFRAAHSAYC